MTALTHWQLGLVTLTLCATACAARRNGMQPVPRDVATIDAHAERTPSVDAGATHIVAATVTRLLAVGWAYSPTLALDGRPGATAVLYLPVASGRFGPADACGVTATHAGPAVGDRLRLVLAPRPAPGDNGGPYALHVRITEGGTTTYWDVRGCTRVQVGAPSQ